jgi:amidase
VTELLPSRTLDRAQALDRHLKLNPGKPVGPLHGLPVSIKGSIAFKGLRMHTGWISWWDNDRPDLDALVIEILENAGAIFHARTTVPQGMMQLETHSNLFGITANPYNSELSSGGSSGGEAALVCMRGSVLGVGSDIGGMFPSFVVFFSFIQQISHQWTLTYYKAAFEFLLQLVLFMDSSLQHFEFLQTAGTAWLLAQIQYQR